MKFNEHFKLGLRSYGDAVKLIFTHKLWRYLIIPLILFAILFYTGHGFEHTGEELQKKMDNGDYSWGWLGLAWLFIKVQFFALLKFLFLDATKYMVIICLSPLLAILSEKTEEILTGNKYKFNLKQLIKDVKRGIGIAIRMLIAEFLLAYVVWNLICKIFGWHDLLVYGKDNTSAIYQTGVILIGSYFYGFAYIDYINERLRLSIRESWNFMRKHAGLAFSIGLVYSLFYNIPSLIPTSNKILNTFLDNFGVLFAPVLAIVAATIAMHELVDLNNSEYAQKNTITNNTPEK